MNKTIELVNGIPHTTYDVGINDFINSQMNSYALLMVILSFVVLAYVLWNNFVRAPSKPKSIKQMLSSEGVTEENILEKALLCDEGIEPSIKVKRISRALDEYLIIPALVMFYITLSYYVSI